jgi:glycosyltransferase involved in cell wall biosynthesis
LEKVAIGTFASTCTASIAEAVKKVDVVHVFSVVSPISVFPAFLAKLAQVTRTRDHKLIVDWEDWWGRGGILHKFNFAIRSTVTFFEEGIPRLADGVTVVSDMLLERALRIGIKPQRLMKLQNGADVNSKPLPKSLARERLGLPIDKTIVCHLGFASLNSLSEQIRQLHREMEFLFVVLGHAPRYGDMRNTFTKPGNIVFMGRQPASEVPYYLAAADILLLDQEPGPSSEARWPVRFGDYLAAGRPIATQRIGEISKVISSSNSGAVTEPGDPRGLANAIVALASDGELCTKLGNNARKVAETSLSWDVLAAKLEHFYEE